MDRAAAAKSFAVAALSAAGVVTVAGLSGKPWASDLASVLGLAISTTAALAIFRHSRINASNARFLQFCGVAIGGCGAVSLVELLGRYLPPVLASALYGGLVVGLTAAFMIAILSLPATRLRLQTVRVFSEAAMIGTAAAAIVYRTFFPELPLWQGVWVQLLLAALCLSMGMAGIAATIESRRGLALCAAGVTMLASSQLLVVHASLEGQVLWPARALAILGWTFSLPGLLLLAPQATFLSDRAIADMERRHMSIVGTAIVICAAGFVVTMAWRPTMDLGMWVLVGIFMAGFWARELTRASQTGSLLLRWLDQAQQDPLTGLGNRRALATRLSELASSPSAGVTVMTVDLDGFKDVNDLAGHAVGDSVLCVVGQWMADNVGNRSEVYRVGGDEFAVLTTLPPDGAVALANRLIIGVEAAASSVRATGTVGVAASIGVQHVAAAELSEHRLLAALTESGHAMRAAKRDGRGRVAVFDERMEAIHRRSRAIEARLRARHSGVGLHYQPVMSLTSGRVLGFEALARWSDEDLGVIAPSEFITVAEGSGLIVELGEGLLRRALADAVSFGMLSEGRTVSVNVSPIQLRSPEFVCAVAEALQAADVAPGSLVIEVTESVFVRAGDPAVRALHELADLGVTIALDDFGAGYASFGYLSRLPIHTIKLDRSLTSGLGQPRADAVARSVIDLARVLDLTVVVEGVETEGQESVARFLGAQSAQGYLYATALPPRDLGHFLSSIGEGKMGA